MLELGDVFYEKNLLSISNQDDFLKRINEGNKYSFERCIIYNTNFKGEKISNKLKQLGFKLVNTYTNDDGKKVNTWVFNINKKLSNKIIGSKV